MMLVLKVILGVLIALLLLLYVGRWWVKRWFRNKVGQTMAAVACIDPRYQQPARITLSAVDAQERLGPVAEAAWAQCHALGFRALGDWHVDAGGLSRLRAAAHKVIGIGLALRWSDEANDDSAGPARFAVLALTDNNRLLAISNDPDETALDVTGIRWRIDPAATPSSALALLSAEVAGQTLRAFDAPLFRAAYERAFAARSDHALASVPQRADFDARLATLPQTVDAATAERAWQMTLTQWHERVAEAALDQFRRGATIDLVRWERIKDKLHVVHATTPDASIRDWLVDDEREGTLAAQLIAQGLHGPALYDALVARLPAHRRQARLGNVTRPLAAVVYGPAEDIDVSSDLSTDMPSAAPPAAAPAAPRAASAVAQDHAYVARDAAGREVSGSIVASSSGDAKRQLEKLGLDSPRVLLEPLSIGAPEPYMLDPEFNAAKARAVTRGLGMALLVALGGNAWLWLPPLLWVGWSLYSGPPYGWGDWLGFGVAGLAVVALLVLILPMILYHELLRARMQARWRQARFCLFLLRRLNLMKALNADQLLVEELKIDAGAGDADGALARWAEREPHLPRDQYLLALASIYDAAGDHVGMIAAQRELRVASAAPDMPTVDLAMSLARHGGNAGADEAEALLATMQVQDLSELVAGGYQFARGLVAAAREQHAVASRHFQSAQQQLMQYRNNPMMHGLLSEIGGHHALALRSGGDAQGASALWTTVAPVLHAAASTQYLVQRWERGAA
jgi:hypothetical protein